MVGVDARHRVWHNGGGVELNAGKPDTGIYVCGDNAWVSNFRELHGVVCAPVSDHLI